MSDDDGKYKSDTRMPLATIGVIGLGVALVELSALPIFAIGVAASVTGNHAPEAFRKIVKGTYTATQRAREIAAEAYERVQDLIAEARSEEQLAKDAELAAETAAEAL